MGVKLKTKHIVMLSRIIGKMDLRFDFKGKSEREIGAEMILGMLSNVHKAEAEFYDLISSVTGKNAEAVADLEIVQLKDELSAIVTEVAGFFRQPPKTAASIT